MASIPKPEALGVCESVPSLKGGRLLCDNISRRDGHIHEHPGGGVVFQDDLVNNTGPRLPELDPVLLGRALQEVKDLLVGDKSTLFRRSVVIHGNQQKISTSRSASAPPDAWIR